MKIGIVSDIHGNIEAWQQSMRGAFKAVDKVLIAGDIYGAGLADSSAPWYQPQRLKKQITHSPIPLLCVRGNCNGNLPEPEEIIGEIYGKKYYMCHGEACTSDEAIKALAKKNEAAYIIYGHTHEWRLEKIGNIIIINPGSPTVPSKKPKHDTFAVMNDKEIRIVDIHTQETLARIENK